MIVVVRTFIMKTGEMESELTIDHSDFKQRRWLGQHCYRALTSGRGVQTFAAEDAPENITAEA